jgi:hypothetical protein
VVRPARAAGGLVSRCATPRGGFLALGPASRSDTSRRAMA